MGYRPRALLDIARGPAEPSAEIARYRGDHRQQDERDQRQLPIQPQQQPDASDDGQRASNGGGDGRRARRRELVGVERELGDQSPGRLRIVKRRGERQQPVDHFLSQIENDAMPGPRHAVLRHERTHSSQQKDRDHGERQLQSHRGVGVLQLLNDRHHHVRHQHVAGCDDDHAHDR